MKKIVVLSGAGVSAESGIKTFRDEDGLWAQYDINDVATLEAFVRNPELVLNFYNARRAEVMDVKPNEAHKAFAQLESDYHVSIITQNIDDLHERAGSSKVYHLHGEITKMRSSIDSSLIYDYKRDIKLGDLCEKGSQLRPHIVWFGEAVPMMSYVEPIVAQADILVIVGTSMQVYPAASLINVAPMDAQIYSINPDPEIRKTMQYGKGITFITAPATRGAAELLDELM